MFSFQNEKGFCIKYVTIWYHPILQYVENSPQTWQEEGWSSPSVVGTLPDVTVWTDWFLLVSAYRGIIVKKSGFHICGDPACPTQQLSCQYTFTAPCLKDLHSQTPQLPEDLSEVSGDADFSNIFPFLWNAILRLLWRINIQIVMYFSSRITVLKRGQIWLPGDIWECLEILFGCYKLGRVLLACTQWVGVRDAANQPPWHRMAIHIKRLSGSKCQ